MKSAYFESPWLTSYLAGVSAEVTIPEKSVNDAFDEATEKWRNKTALFFYGRKISYQELREKVDRFATALSNLGIKKGDRVALLLLNSPEYIISFYAILKLGAIATAISPVYVSSEVKHQLEDSGAENIICQDILYEALEATGLKFKNVILTNISESLPQIKRAIGKSILRGVYQKMASPSPEIITRKGFHKFQELIEKHKPEPPRVDINIEEDIAILPYTGGTTGQPRGVMLTHRNVIANITQYRSTLPFLEDGSETSVGFMPFYHAGGLFFQVLLQILFGNKILIFTTPELDEVLYTTSNQRATYLACAPTMFEKLKDYEKTSRVNWKKFKIVISGADALHEYTAKDWEARTGVRLYEVYGMTEFVCLSHCDHLGTKKIGSFGIPMPNTMSAILDPDKDEFLPVEELGEIVVSGPQVTKGYWKNEEATKECETIIDGTRWWRTGDLGKMDKDGYFYTYDRKRDLIKYKGLRIHAREVEEVMKTHPKIKEVGVIGVKDIKVGENVKAFIVLETDSRGNLSEEDIIEYCKGKLTPYKIPKIIEFVGEIPRTDIGKVSRRELRESEEG